MLQNVQALGVSSHQAVLDAVVHHLDEMSGARRAAVQVAFFGGVTHFFAPGSSLDIAAPGCERLEDRIKPLHNVRFPANHLAVAALKPPDSATRAHITVMNTSRG